ncbi:response regulator transcription factor [Terrimonas sp. NA20]|uniref:Response regulator transcription factor n=1 Tax=Terrimonas ginsenosidimutans TaxID=2908004 RepID=A0ABS9KV20_9BACT|nr:response regulator transcription factor [Terrimonas ginsenosidimutans]MCG2616166.1 response regulator transcription factor [Terrimonas ginsenosidimutans]
MTSIRIGLVDDQVLFRQGLSALIRSEPGFLLILEAGDGSDCLQQLANTKELPDIILADMEMPGMDGIELNERLQKEYPSVKIIVVSVHTTERLIARMIEQGASGYLAKNCDKAELLIAIKTVASTGFYINARVLKAIQNTSAIHHNQSLKNMNGIPVELSPREKEILLLICKEYTAGEIASQLFLSARTVEGHRNNLLQKTGRRNTAGLVLFAVKYHLHEVTF